MGDSSRNKPILGKNNCFEPTHDNWQHFFQIVKKLKNFPFPVTISGGPGSGKEFCAAYIKESLGITDQEVKHVNFEKDLIELLESNKRIKCFVINQGKHVLENNIQLKLLDFISQRQSDTQFIWLSESSIHLQLQNETLIDKLYQVINIYEIALPNLSDLKNDMQLIASYFLKNILSGLPSPPKFKISPKQVKELNKYTWQTNFDELEFVLKRSIANSLEGTFKLSFPAKITKSLETSSVISINTSDLITDNFEESVNEFKKKLVLESIRNSGGNKSKAAKVLGISKAYIFRMIQSLNIDID